MQQAVSSEITRTRNALLAYVARYGVTEADDARQLAARVWRAIPRGLNAAAAVVAVERLLGQWASQLLGFGITAAQLRFAVLETGADARQLLADDVAGFIAAIEPALVPATPHETPVNMPVQELGRTSFFGLFSATPVAVRHTV